MNISKLCLVLFLAFAFTAPLSAHKYINTSSGLEEPLTYIDISATLFTNEEDVTMSDSLQSKAGKSNRNVMLNAESATIPREINIGLPESGTGAIVYVDGMKHASGLPRAHFHWAGGNAYESIKTMSIIESLIYTGEIGIVVDSKTKMGGELLSGRFTASTSTNGLLRFDGILSGPINKKKGLYFSTGAYFNYDPTNVNAPGRYFIDQKQILQFSLSKRWLTSNLDFIYRYSRCDDNIDNGYSVAPFVYNGNGSITELEGFKIGHDCYMPEDDEVTWRDIVSGEMKSSRLGKMDKRYLHDLSLKYSSITANDWDLRASYHLCLMTPSQYTRIVLSSIHKDGEKFVQNRLVTVEDQKTFDNEFLLEVRKRFSRHNLRLGLDIIYANQYDAGSTFNFAHTVEANPQRLKHNGAYTWNYNNSGLYLDAQRMSVVVYGMDQWQLGRNLRLSTGLRVRYLSNSPICAPFDRETGINNRQTGNFYLGSPNCELKEIPINGFDYSVSEALSWRLTGRLFANVEGFYSLTNKSTLYFKGANIPSLKAIGNAYARCGLSYDNEWMDVACLFSYITSWNNAKIMDVSDSSTGEIIPWTAQYGIRTFGLTLDGNIHFGGFKLHMLGTWQDPRYKNYRNEFNFSGGTKTIDYSGKFVTGISQGMIEFDPSYSWNRYKVWSSIRYYSKQYASRNNLAYFDGHFETFAGFSANLKKYGELALNIVNVLGDKGANGSLDIVDTIEDPDILINYLTSGTYIRPFMVEMSYTYSF